MTKPIIEIDNICKRYRLGANKEQYLSLRDEVTKAVSRWTGRDKSQAARDFWALNGVSFSVNEGEAVGIIGRNGAGKSTLLKILSQITPPTEGRVTMRGRVASLLEVGTGFHPELSGRENIYLNGTILSMTRAEISRKFDEIVSFSEVEKFLDTPVKRYSSGMYVRLAFAVAAHLEPEILIIDEVLAVGDSAFQKKCIEKMKDVSQEGRTVLFVSHNLSTIENLCQRSVMLNSGNLIMEGPTSDVIKRYVSEIYMNEPDGDLIQRIDRSGTGTVKLAKIILRDMHLNEVLSVASGEECFVDFEYISKDIYSNIIISWNIRDEKGQSLMRLSSFDTGNDDGDFPQQGVMRCHIERMPLVPASYRINVEIRVNGIISDFIDGAYIMRVVGGDFYGTGRLNSHSPVLLDHHWECVK